MSESCVGIYKSFNKAILSPYVFVLLLPIAIVNILWITTSIEFFGLVSRQYYDIVQIGNVFNNFELNTVNILSLFVVFVIVLLNVSTLCFVHLNAIYGYSLRNNMKEFMAIRHVILTAQIIVVVIVVQFLYSAIDQLAPFLVETFFTTYRMHDYINQTLTPFVYFIKNIVVFFVVLLTASNISLVSRNKQDTLTINENIRVNFFDIVVSYAFFISVSYVIMFFFFVINSNVQSGILLNGLHISFNVVINHLVVGLICVAACFMNVNLTIKK